jgi:hypothetical protein
MSSGTEIGPGSMRGKCRPGFEVMRNDRSVVNLAPSVDDGRQLAV